MISAQRSAPSVASIRKSAGRALVGGASLKADSFEKIVKY